MTVRVVRASLLALPLALICLRVRLKLEDTPEFEEMAENHEVTKSPLLDVVRNNPLSVLKVIGIAIAMNGSGYIGLTYFSVYLINDLGFSKDSVYWTSAIAIAKSLGAEPLVHHAPACLVHDEPFRAACLHVVTTQVEAASGAREVQSFEGDARYGRACDRCAAKGAGCHGLPAAYWEADPDAAERWLTPIDAPSFPGGWRRV